MKKMCQKITAILLTLVMTLTMLPVHVLATAGIPPSALPETLSATAQIGGEDYAILYSDYIAVYVRKSDGGFAVLPASETFDGTKPLSFATLRVDGREYRYGTYYEGATGEISIAPYAENGLIQSHQVIGNFTVSQYFAITRDESREGAYAVKIGYAAEYFGEGEAKAGARIALDTRFSAREYIPLVLTDIEDGVALVDTEVKIPFAPKSAAVTKEFVEAEGYDDTPNKGFILFLDDAWDDPSAVAFTTPAALELAYDYEPLAADIPLFDGSSDSAAAIYWEDAALSADGDTLALFGVNYGFTDMAAAGKGEGVFALDLTPSALDAPLTTNAAAAMMQTMAADTATVYIGHSSIPGEWFNLTASSPFAALSEAIYSDEYGSSYWDAENFWLADQYHKATISAGADFALSLTYGQNTPQLIRDAVQKYHVSLNWDGGGSEIAEAEVNIGEIFTIAGAELFSHYRPGTDENLSVNITPIITPPAGYALLVLSGDSGASSSLASSGELLYYCGDGVSGGSLTLNNNAYWSGLKYFAKTDETLTVTMQMSDLDHRPKLSSDPGIPANSPYIQWSYNNLIPPQPAAMTPVQGQTGPWVYAFTQDIPSAAVSGEIAALTVQDAAGTALYPINLIADNVSDYNLLHSALADSANVSFGQGILWGTESGTVTIDMTSLGGKTVNVYKAGTTTLLAAGSASTIIFTMPGEAVDIVIGNEYRVFTAVSGATEGVTVDFSPANPDGSTEVYAYASIFGDHTLSGITVAKGADGSGDAVSTTALPGGGVKFTMPSDNDVLITASVTAQSGALHSVTVRPLAGDGQTWYDVHFWTDSNNGRLPYETDESGRIGKIRAGTIVYYALYPTTWDTDFTDIELWTVDDFTINSETPEVFAPITSGPAYFPASYSTSTQNAGFFPMPDKDVVFEVFGHKTNVAYQLKTVMEDVSGNPISGYESHVKLFNGLDAEVNSAFPGDGITVKAPWGFGDNHAFKRIYITSARETINITSGTAFNMPKGDATVHIVYDGLPTQTLSIMNPYLFTDDGNYGGEAQVLLYGVDAGANMALNTNTYSKSMYLEQDGKLKAEIALRYAPDYGYSYKLMKDGSEVSSPEVRESAGGAWVTKSYKCTLDADSPITLTVAQSGVAKTLALGDDLMPNSPNTAVFSSVSLMGGWDSLTGNYVNLKTLFEGGQSPTITKVSLVGKNGATQVYSQAQTDSPSINAAIGYPDKYRGVTLTDLGYAEGQVMSLDLGTLLNLQSLTEGTYTLTIEWTYGENNLLSGAKRYSFDLSPDSFSPGDIKYVAAVRTEKPRQNGNKLLSATGDYILVPATDKGALVTALQAQAGHTDALLTFYCERGFTLMSAADADYREYHSAAGAEVMLNGNAKFSAMWGSGFLTLSEKAEKRSSRPTPYVSVNATIKDMSLIAGWMPVWVPIQAGGPNLGAGTDTLYIDLAAGETYEIPYEYPIYSKTGYATDEDAETAFFEEIDELKSKTVVIEPGWEDGEVALTIGTGAMQFTGLKAKVNDIYLLGTGFDVGGMLVIQIPGTSDPLFVVDLKSLVTDNNAAVIPIENVWAAGEGTVKLPDWIGGEGGAAEGEINTFTQTFRLAGAVNLLGISVSGEFELKRSERLKIPFLNTFILDLDVGDMEIGIPIAPPVPILDLTGASGGIRDLISMIDYDPRVQTIPSFTMELGGHFALVKVINFDASMTSGLTFGSISASGAIGVGPLTLSIIEELSFGLGMKDGEYDYTRSIRRLLFYAEATADFNIINTLHGELTFRIQMQCAPAFWEWMGDVSSIDDLVNNFGFEVGGYGSGWAAVTFPLTQIVIADSFVSIDINFKPTVENPFQFTKFLLTSSSQIGPVIDECTYDMIAAYPGLKSYIQSKINARSVNTFAAPEGISGVAVQSSVMSALSAIADGELRPDAAYKAEHRILGLGNAAVDSENRPAAAAQSRMMRAIAQDTANVRVNYDNGAYTHIVTVPDNGTNYVLQLEGYGADALDAADLRVVKPNGQALTVRVAEGIMTAEQAASGYNAYWIDGVLTLVLSDYANTVGSDSSLTTDQAIGDTLPGEWQVTSAKPFRSKLVELVTVPGIASATFGSNTLTVNFNDAVTDSYTFDVILERRETLSGEPLDTYRAAEGLTISSNAGTWTLPTGAAALNLSPGDWYPRVILREAGTADISGAIVGQVLCETPYVAAVGYTWTPALTVKSGGNQSVAVTFAGLETAPAGMTVRGYKAVMYDAATKAPATKLTTGGDGKQSVQILEYTVPASMAEESGNFSVSFADVAAGTYYVGLTPVFGRSGGETILGAQLGAEVFSSDVTVAASSPPSLTLGLTSGSIIDAGGSPVALVGANGGLSAATDTDATVAVSDFDGTHIADYDTNLAAYSGKTLMITAKNSTSGDSTMELLTVYADTAAPMLDVPDKLVVAADGGYTLNGVTEPGASVGFATAGGDGTFSVSGKLADGESTIIVTATDKAGNTSVREIEAIWVSSASITGIEIQPGGSITATVGDTFALSVVAALAGGNAYVAQDLISYTVSGPGTAQNGVLTISGSGTVTVTATVAGYTAVLTVTVATPSAGGGGSPSGASAAISVSTAAYDAESGEDIVVTLTPGEHTLTAIKNGDATLVKGTDYTVSGSTVTIKSEYLSTLAPGRHTLTFDMSGGTDPVLTITIEDSETPLGAWANPFTDVDESAWYYDDVGFAYTHGLFTGTSATTFSPQMPMTRGMLVTVLGRLAGADTGKYTASSFSDVAEDQYYTAFVEWAAQSGIVLGIGGNLFAPDSDVTREQMAVILYRYARFMDINLPKKNDRIPFADDAEIADYAREALYAMQEAGIIGGKPGNIADPRGSATRAEVAAILRRYINRL